MTETEKQTKMRGGSLAVIFLTIFVDLLGFGMVLPLLPLYADQYAIDPSGWKIGLLMASFSFMQFLFAPLWGMLSDRVGRRPVLMVGLTGSIAFYALFGYAAITKSLAWLFVSRIGAGVAGATISTAQAYVADCTKPEERTRGMALVGMAVGLGFTFGPLIGLMALPSGRGDPGPLPGFAASGLSLVALIMAIFLLPESRRPDSDASSRTWLDVGGLRVALRRHSILLVLLAYFVCVFAFVKFETTLSMLIHGGSNGAATPFQFSWAQICFTFAFIGFTLAIIQGAIIRPVSKHVSEQGLAVSGTVIELFGFAAVVFAVLQSSIPLLFFSLVVVVAGFACLQPSLNALISRWTSPEKQGAVMGLAQSLNAMARILRSAIGIPLLKLNSKLPYVSSGLLMLLVGGFIIVASRIRYRENTRDRS